MEFWNDWLDIIAFYVVLIGNEAENSSEIPVHQYWRTNNCFPTGAPEVKVNSHPAQNQETTHAAATRRKGIIHRAKFLAPTGTFYA
jgi:hypothetical protein